VHWNDQSKNPKKAPYKPTGGASNRQTPCPMLGLFSNGSFGLYDTTPHSQRSLTPYTPLSTAIFDLSPYINTSLHSQPLTQFTLTLSTHTHSPKTLLKPCSVPLHSTLTLTIPKHSNKTKQHSISLDFDPKPTDSSTPLSVCPANFDQPEPTDPSCPLSVLSSILEPCLGFCVS